MDNQKYGAALRVSKEHDMPFDEIKRILTHKITETIITPMLNSGLYHVCKFDIAKQEDYWWDEYYIIANLSVARVQNVVFHKMEELTVEWNGKKLERVCLHWGIDSALIFAVGVLRVALQTEGINDTPNLLRHVANVFHHR